MAEKDFIRHKFTVGEEPEVLTSVSDQCSDGKCETCPGIFHRDDFSGKSIFCVHACHEKQNQENLPGT
jgi:hypothetical protein